MNPKSSDMHAIDDTVIPFQIAETNIRGRIVTLSKSLNTILSAHQYPRNISELTGDVACLAVLMGSLLKFDGKMILQAQGDGDVSLVVSDYQTSGAIRAMAKYDGAAAENRGIALLGKGHFAVTVDQGADMDRYQGVTPLDGDTMGTTAATYFNQSEQIPSAFKIATGRVMRIGQDEEWRARGIMLQILPTDNVDREKGELDSLSNGLSERWERSKIFLETVKDDELLDPMVGAESLLYRLFHEEGVSVFEPQVINASCGCNAEKISAVLSRYETVDLADMVVDGVISVTCEFCRTQYDFSSDGRSIGAT